MKSFLVLHSVFRFVYVLESVMFGVERNTLRLVDTLNNISVTQGYPRQER